MITLTTAFNPGDLDTTTYSKVRITRYIMNTVENWISLTVEYGNYTNSQWTKGVAPEKNFTIQGSDFATLVVKAPQNGETIYEAAARELYNYLIDKGYFIGTH